MWTRFKNGGNVAKSSIETYGKVEGENDIILCQIVLQVYLKPFIIEVRRWDNNKILSKLLEIILLLIKLLEFFM